MGIFLRHEVPGDDNDLFAFNTVRFARLFYFTLFFNLMLP